MKCAAGGWWLLGFAFVSGLNVAVKLELDLSLYYHRFLISKTLGGDTPPPRLAVHSAFTEYSLFIETCILWQQNARFRQKVRYLGMGNPGKPGGTAGAGGRGRCPSERKIRRSLAGFGLCKICD